MFIQRSRLLFGASAVIALLTACGGGGQTDLAVADAGPGSGPSPGPSTPLQDPIDKYLGRWESSALGRWIYVTKVNRVTADVQSSLAGVTCDPRAFQNIGVDVSSAPRIFWRIEITGTKEVENFGEADKIVATGPVLQIWGVGRDPISGAAKTIAKTRDLWEPDGPFPGYDAAGYPNAFYPLRYIWTGLNCS